MAKHTKNKTVQKFAKAMKAQQSEKAGAAAPESSSSAQTITITIIEPPLGLVLGKGTFLSSVVRLLSA